MKKFIISFLVGFITAYAWEFFAINILKKDSLILFNQRLHHSLYGLFFILIGSLNKKVVLVGFGLGIITQHTITDGFRFISSNI